MEPKHPRFKVILFYSIGTTTCGILLLNLLVSIFSFLRKGLQYGLKDIARNQEIPMGKVS